MFAAEHPSVYMVEVEAGRMERLPPWVEEARIARYYGIPPWEVAAAPARWINRTRLLAEADEIIASRKGK